MRDILRTCGPFQPLPNSLYAAELTLKSYPQLAEHVRASIVVVGGGITGLSTAISLAEQGADCVVLEANQPGWGASGRNGGNINPGLKATPAEIEERFGRERGRQVIEFAYGAADRVFDLAQKYRIDCEIIRGGGYRAAVNERHALSVRRLFEECAAGGMPVELHEADRMAQVTGTNRYVTGLLDKRGGQLNPLKYAFGLAAAAEMLGVRVFGDSPVTSVVRDGSHWRIVTPSGEVSAERILFATNGYTDQLVPGLSRSIIPVFSSIVSSAPLPTSLASRLLSGGQTLFEAGRITTYYRVDRSKRLIFGGRGVMRDVSGAAQCPDLISYAERLWPELKGIVWEYGWNGRIAITADHYPHVHDFGDGRLVCLGYNGRGIAVATAIGTQLARALLQAPPHAFDLPLLPIKQIAFQPWWKAGAVPVILLSRVADRLGY